VRLRRRRRPELLSFLTRDGCSLCADALPGVQRLAARAGVPVEVRDVDADSEQGRADHQRWSDHVPVVLLDGEQHAMWFVDEAELARALAGR
jgi:glutaredoxin